MRHKHDSRNLGRKPSHKKSTLRNLAKSLVTYEMVQTTDAKAKELSRVADKLITLGKRGSDHAWRQAQSKLQSEELVDKLFEDLAQRDEIANREGGYTRVLKVGNRNGDDAPISRVSFVGADLESTEHLRFPEHILELIETEEVDELDEEDNEETTDDEDKDQKLEASDSDEKTDE